MTTKDDGNKNPQSAKVLQLGFNISVSGDPGTDFEIVLDKEQKAIQLPSQPSDGLQDLENNAPKNEIEKTHFQDEVKPPSSTGAIPKHRKYLSGMTSSESAKMSDIEKPESTIHKDSSLINEIKSTMEHFEKFSDHIREIPRLKSHPLATSTPFSDKQNSKSESSLIYPEYRPRRFAHLYDFHSRKEYFKGSIKPLPPDLFLKPLPGEDCYKRGNFTRYLDVEPYKHYGSVDSLNKTSDYKNAMVPKSKYDIEKYDLENLTGEAPVGILKKSDSENGDKQSTSSADSIKDIKIYQSGGIIIMQNFKDNMDMIEKKEISDFSAKLIENCHKLRDEITSGFPDDRPAIGNSSDEGKNSGKMVQFDLSGFEGQKSKSGESLGNVKGDCSPVRMESSESTSDCVKIKDTSPQGTSQSQDFPSLSTQENDSVVSNQPGMSPTFASGKKLEWDSGADVGYLNLDLSKENLSTIERIVLKGISSDGLREKKVVYEKKPEQAHTNRSKFILERMSSDSITEDISENKSKTKSEENMPESSGSDKKEKLLRSKQEKLERKPHEDKPSKRHSTDVSKEHSKESSTQFTGEELELPADGKVTSKHEGSQEEDKLNQKIVVSSDKSVNVNTLFEDAHPPISGQTNRTEDFKHVEYPKIKAFKLSPKVKKLKKKKVSNQKNLTGPLKDKIDSIIDIARCSSRNTGSGSFEMGIPKKIYKKLEAKPELNDFELSRDLEEIIIDQRFKIKQSLAVGRETSKGTAVASKNDENEESKKETKAKSRPISASSSSNNTVLPNAEAKELPGKKDIVQSNKFTDQIIQTNNCKVESVGIQAFDSLKSSEGDAKILKDVEDAPKVVRDRKENANVSSKNIQSFGLNSSLPKELAHPKESKLIDNQNTKSTQFFGGPINSLPNYHASLVTKPGESCGRMPKVLKAKKNLEAEIIRLKEENEKNIMANEGAKISEVKKRRENNPENKENLVTEKSVGSRRSQSNASRNMSKGNRNNEASQESEKNSKEKENPDSRRNKIPSEKETNSREESECLRTSEEVSSKILTSEVLREHGDSIDRNIIQEKYFQSQLIELEKREMISRSTSMEKHLESQSQGRELVTTGCQYSPQSKETVSESKGKPNVESRRKETSEQYDDSSQNLLEEERFGTSKSTNQEQDFEAGDSLPSSTQTAHSWIPGMRDFGEGARSGVGRARSFEYLPGHIYESSGNLREELPSETEQNLITSSSSESNAAKRSVSEEGKDSEGRNTLVLENSTEASQESDKMKNLNENLTQLDIVVAKLREKEIQIQTITQTLLVKLKKENNGSGDHSQALGARQEPSTLKPKGVEKSSQNCSEGSKEGGDCRSGVSSTRSRKQAKEKDVSIACQTEEKSSASGPEKFYQERRALERRISEEKESQIKWIENEIHHLNILRGLLEKQSFSSLKKKKRSSLSASSNEESKITEKYPKEISGEVYPQAVTPVYGCTISLVENNPNEGCDESRESPAAGSPGEAKKYGMAVSLSGGTTNAQRMVMIPVGVQVTLKDVKLTKECSEAENGESQFRRPSTTPPNSICREPGTCGHHHHHRRISHSDANTQYPSPRRTSKNFYSTYAQTSFSSSVRCSRCQQTNCVCLDLSDKSYDSTSRSYKSKISEKRKSLRLSFEENEEAVTGIGEKTRSDSTVAEVLDIESDPVSKASQRNLEKSAGSRTESLGSCLQRRTVQDADCKCGNCSKIGAKPGRLCRGPCESNIYLNCEKSSKGFGTCRCSKIQVQKSSNCACHIIKIHGSKCSSAENDQKSSCSCKRSAKKTENQSCQTEEVSAGSRDPVKKGEETCGGKTAVESRAPAAEFPYSPEDSHERRRPCFHEKKEVPKEIPERDVPAPGCSCQKNRQKEKPKVDDHPRHYFLKIEETEVEDLNESMERRKSLEVITVTVPVKKAGKAKIYGNRFRQSCQGEQFGEESFKDSFPNFCKCCKDCPGSRKAPEATKTTAEKQESPRRANHFPKPVEWDFFGDAKNYGEVDNLRYRDPNCQSEEFHQQRNGPDYAESKAYCFDQCRKESRKSRADHWDRSPREDSPRGEVHDEYDSHKEGRRLVEGEASTFHEEGREYRQSRGGKVCQDKRERFGQDPSVESRNNRCQVNDRGFDRRNPDYYNYNKREFMTKSELLREEEKKRVRQPSLQESLASNRPDFCSSAESRRQMISERVKERVRRHNNRMECLINLMHHCDDRDQTRNTGQRRMFTTSEMREQTMKKYKKLPEVTGRIADEKKKQEYRTNKLMGDIYGKKLQIQALKGHINLSNSVSVLSTI